MRKIFSALDIGSNTIKLVVGEFTLNKLNILCAVKVPSYGFKANYITNKNALKEDKYSNKESNRTKLRKKYGLENKTIIGNIGRLNYQKNQSFLLDIFAQYLLLDENAELLLIGKGEEERALKEKVKKLDIASNVIFLGMKENVIPWYSVFDIFVFPSHFEGLGLVLLEAQANGVPVLATKDTIPTDVKVNENLEFISLSKSARYWAEKIKNNLDNDARIKSKEAIVTNFQKSNYDIDLEAERVEKLFLSTTIK